jgi:hypothetical protein
MNRLFKSRFWTLIIEVKEVNKPSHSLLFFKWNKYFSQLYIFPLLYVLYFLKEDQALAKLKLICLYVMFVNTYYRIFVRMFYKLIYERKCSLNGFANDCVMTPRWL